MVHQYMNNTLKGRVVNVGLVSIIVALLGSVFGPSILFATGASNTLTASVAVQSTCVPTLSNSAITFPDTQPGGFAAVANAEQVTVASSGNAGSNILVAAGAASGLAANGNWATDSFIGTNTFNVGNTVWDIAVHSSSIVGNQLTTSAVDTKIKISSAGGSNNIFFGANVPPGQGAATYGQNIVVSTSC